MGGSIVYQLKIRRIGNSLGVVIPKAALQELDVSEGDIICLTSAPDGFRVTQQEQEFSDQIDAFEEGRKRYRNALRELAK